MKPEILVARAVFPSVLARLREHFEVESNDADASWDAAELTRRLQGKAGAFTTGSERIDAPVVPITLPSNAPIASKPVLRAGLPCRLPRMKIPPATVNRVVSSTMNGMYSAISVCASTPSVAALPLVSRNGTTNSAAQPNAILPK